MIKKLVRKALNFVYARPRLRRIYWYLRAPFSSYAASCFANERIAQDLMTDGQFRVLHGPFKGMIYTRHGSTVSLPCLLGSYEMEVWPAIESLKPGRYDIIIDVGCAEGYYACGLARLTGTQVLAYDTSDSAQRDCHEMATLNNLTDLVTIKSFLTREELESLCSSKRAFVFCDIEFSEADLLDPQRVPSLAKTDILVETHAFRANDPNNTLPIMLQRFEATHDLTVFPMRPRHFDEIWDFVEKRANNEIGIGKVANELLLKSFVETRFSNNWVWMKAKSNG